jgi:hypothetical protein
MNIENSSNSTENSNTRNENPPNLVLEPTPSRCFPGQFCSKPRLRALGLILLVAGLMGVTALDYLLPVLPDHPKGDPARLVWYVHHGQLKADMHTLVSVIEFVLAPDSEHPSTSTPTNAPMVGKSAPTSSRS